MGYLHDEDGYLLVFYCVDDSIVSHSNSVVVTLVAARHVEVFQLLVAMRFRLLRQILYFFKYPILHL